MLPIEEQLHLEYRIETLKYKLKIKHIDLVNKYDNKFCWSRIILDLIEYLAKNNIDDLPDWMPLFEDHLPRYIDGEDFIDGEIINKDILDDWFPYTINDSRLFGEIIFWCIENLKYNWSLVDTYNNFQGIPIYIIYFESDEDAALYMMKWT